MESYIEPEKIEGGVRRLLLQLKEEKWKREVIEEAIKEHKETIEILSNLPNKLKHKVIVPFSKVAFYEGEIKYTNNIFQNLGGNAFCERTTKKAEEHLQRKLSFYETKHKILTESIDKLTKEIELALEIKEGAKWENNEDNAEGVFLRPDGFLEIREKYDSDEEKSDEKEEKEKDKEKTKEKEKEKIKEKEKKKDITQQEGKREVHHDIEVKKGAERQTDDAERTTKKEDIKRECNETQTKLECDKEWENQKNILSTQRKKVCNKAINKDPDGFISIKENYSSSSNSDNSGDSGEEK